MPGIIRNCASKSDEHTVDFIVIRLAKSTFTTIVIREMCDDLHFQYVL